MTVRPVRVLPLASFKTAVSCTVCATATLAEAGLTVTVATGTLVTEMADVPLFPSLVAVIVAEPTATPVTKPLPLTVAAPVLELVHVTVRPVRVVPLASLSVAVSCTVPFVPMVADAGVTVTEATGVFLAAAVTRSPDTVTPGATGWSSEQVVSRIDVSSAAAARATTDLPISGTSHAARHSLRGPMLPPHLVVAAGFARSQPVPRRLRPVATRSLGERG